jgi:hypothetical protein
VRVATTANLPTSAATATVLTLSPAVTVIDGVTLATNDRILVKNQTATKDNGIYVYTNSTTLTRASDADNSPAGEVTSGMFTFVEEGTTNPDTGWALTTNNPITVGTTGLTFTQFSGAGSITAGSGASVSGNQVSVNVDNVTLEIVSNQLKIKSTYVGQTSITTLGTITSGTWNGSTVAVAYGGTGATTTAGAKTNLGFMTRYASDLVGSASVTQFIRAHGMGTADVLPMVYNKSTGQVVMADLKVDATNVTVDFGSDFVGSTYRLVVLG